MSGFDQRSCLWIAVRRGRAGRRGREIELVRGRVDKLQHCLALASAKVLDNRTRNDCHIAFSNTPTTKSDEAVIHIPGSEIQFRKKDCKAYNGDYNNTALY